MQKKHKTTNETCEDSYGWTFTGTMQVSKDQKKHRNT